MTAKRNGTSNRVFSSAPVLIFALIFCGWSGPVSRSHAFTVGSDYEMLLNAFVMADDGTAGVEGHFAQGLNFDGQPSRLPLNRPYPRTLEGNELVVIEAMRAHRGFSEAQWHIVAGDGGNIVHNPFQASTFGRVTLSLGDLLWQDGTEATGWMGKPWLQVADSQGVFRAVNVPGVVSGKGTGTSPWRVQFTVPATEFGERTAQLRIGVSVRPIPEPAGMGLGLLAAWAVLGRMRQVRG